MGADLCGYMLFGPKRLRKQAILGARKAARPLVAAVRHELEKGDPFMEDKIGSTLKGLDREDLADTFSVYPDANENLEGDKLIDLFVSMWHDCDYRDVTMRTDPCDASRQVLFAGQLTWGDGPEPESGWWVCQAMAVLGLLKPLGVE